MAFPLALGWIIGRFVRWLLGRIVGWFIRRMGFVGWFIGWLGFQRRLEWRLQRWNVLLLAWHADEPG